VVIDDLLLRDVLVGERPQDLGGLAPEGIATTGLWLFRLCSSLADPSVVGKLSEPVVGLPAELQAQFRSQLTALPAQIEVLPMRDLAWLMAELQTRHRGDGRAHQPRWSRRSPPLTNSTSASPYRPATLGPIFGRPHTPTASASTSCSP
jgi:hypothetical protein